MSQRVKGTRSYHSPRRVEQAAATREHILRTARAVLESEGYATTSVAAIAAAAEVSSKTLYLAFSTKSGLLRSLWDLALGGEDDQKPVTAREWYREMADSGPGTPPATQRSQLPYGQGARGGHAPGDQRGGPGRPRCA